MPLSATKHCVPGLRVCLLLATTAWLPTADAAQKQLASTALASAIDEGNFDQIRQEIVMDLHQGQSFEFDENGVDALGKRLLARGDKKMAIEVLQFNIAVHPQSPSSANALGDAYQKLGNPVAAREYYKMALKTDPDNEHAKRSLSEFTPEGSDSSASTLQNPEAYSDETSTPMEQLSAMMSPEQMEQVEAYMANAERMQKKTAARSGRAASSQTRMGDEERAVAARAKRCDDLAAKYNPFGGKAALAKLIGHYGASEDTKRLKTWNIDFTCEGRALWAIPLWGDVAPPQLEPLSANSFRDAWGGVWEFDIDNSGQARGVTVTDSNGRRKLIRLGAPKSLG